MNIQLIEEALTIPETALRCQRVLDEVQPVLRRLMDDFKNKYGGQAPELLDYQVHTYESTLRTTMHDARNPKHAEKKRTTDMGKKAFVELIDNKYFQSEFGVLTLELNGLERKFKTILASNFYPFWEGVRTKGNAKELTDAIGLLSDHVQIFNSDKDSLPLTKEEVLSYVKQSVKDNKKPWLYFGAVIDFDQLPSTGELVNHIWNTWLELHPIREYLERETSSHARSLQLLELFNQHQKDISITLYGKNYDVKFDEQQDVKSNKCRQVYSVLDKGQLIAKLALYSFLREPNEVIGIKVDGSGQIYSNLRALHGLDQVEWRITKSYYSRGRDDSSEVNKVLQAQAMAALEEHGFQVDGSTFYVATWDNGKLSFVEPIEEVKKRLFIAGALLADCSGKVNFPKQEVGNENGPPDDLEEDNDTPNDEGFQHDFNLSTILSNLDESPFTYSAAIIRDFHLNLTSLEDKHFVILNGISGTGKTRLCLLYANAVYGKAHDALNPYLRVIPVRPDWTDSTSLFGYYSALEKRYVRTPFLNAVLQAIQEGKPMFVVLDEMNLARVEYYLSDYLSAIESRQPIRLHTESQVTDVPQELQIPHNLYVIGTINVDETTHSISDKVLDRAFVMTLSDVDLEKFWNAADSKYKVALQEEWKMLQELHEKLSRYELHFGYRTMNEMLRKLYANAELDLDIRMEKNEAVDRVIAEKVLPKIRGDEQIEALLTDLIDWTATLFGDGSESLYHLLRMKGELDRYGATQFWR
ncbi:McrB family protein [Paenibacillus arenilitoris]|uniref:AAA family ATPase n=1 Tax=Paenibacillus arenilitoris TaxID=2772299 RepID=A0A927CUN9_9BACL|nr:AAA family ATPase [Paenibacillus arenilitoris]MBD2872541.1 AAA family ATPase [Paenibacillus arenilitoris]